MIHLVAVISFASGIGRTLYEAKESVVRIESNLLYPLVSSFSHVFSHELHHEEKGFREIEFETLRVVIFDPYVYVHDPALKKWQYLSIQDIHDNVAWSVEKLKAVHSILMKHEDIQLASFSVPIEARNEISRILAFTQKFPSEIKEQVSREVKMLFMVSSFKMLLAAIADIDEGIIHSWPRPRTESFFQEKGTKRIFLELLSEIPFTKDLWLEATLAPPEEEMQKEGWAIVRIGENTDFVLMARAVIPVTNIMTFRQQLEGVAATIYDLIKDKIVKRSW
ncbi:MAG: hypothetical protein ACFFD4_13030 [Candidatus Odinarchaeota archaeon]